MYICYIIKEHRRNNNLITIICNLIHRCHRYRTRPQYRLSFFLSTCGRFVRRRKSADRRWGENFPPLFYVALLLMHTHICCCRCYIGVQDEVGCFMCAVLVSLHELMLFFPDQHEWKVHSFTYFILYTWYLGALCDNDFPAESMFYIIIDNACMEKRSPGSSFMSTIWSETIFEMVLQIEPKIPVFILMNLLWTLDWEGFMNADEFLSLWWDKK